MIRFHLLVENYFQFPLQPSGFRFHVDFQGVHSVYPVYPSYFLGGEESAGPTRPQPAALRLMLYVMVPGHRADLFGPRGHRRRDMLSN